MRNLATSRAVLAGLAAGVALAALPTQAAAQLSGPFQYHSLTPCRLADTRNITPPVLISDATRTFQIQGLCAIPVGAKAVSINITVVRPNGPGYVSAFPTGITRPTVSSVNFAAGEPAIANGAIVPLADQATHAQDLSVYAWVAATGGNVHLVLDVTGYFQ
jgi:hypothetical protein